MLDRVIKFGLGRYVRVDMLPMAALSNSDYWEMELRGLEKTHFYLFHVTINLIWSIRSYDWQLVISPQA